MSNVKSIHDDDRDEYPYVPPTQSTKQKFTEVVDKVKPVVPYMVLVWAAKTQSTNWLLVSIFSLIAIKDVRRYVTVTDSHFTSSSDAPGLVIR